MPCLHSPVVSTTEPSASTMAWSKNESGCCRQTVTRLSLMTSIRVSMSAALNPAQEVTSGGRVGDALRPQDVEVGFVVAQQLQVVDGSAPGQQVEREVEDVVGFKVRDVSLEEMEPGVEGVGQPQALPQQVQNPQASAVEAFGL